MQNLGKTGIIGRFKPLHLGSAKLLERVCENAREVIIGIGSSNRRDIKNPFTAEETEEMIRAFLSPRFTNYSIIYVPDFYNGAAWATYVRREFGKLDSFVTGNPYVAKLLKPYYHILNSKTALNVPVPTRSTQVRLALARGEDWQRLVPKEISNYMLSHGLDLRFKNKYGKTLVNIGASKDELRGDASLEAERARVMQPA